MIVSVSCVRQGYYMELKHFALQQSSVALTLLSMAEFVTYVVASFLGDYLKDRLVYVNVVSSSCLAVVCIAWPFIDVDYILILAVSLGHLPHLPAQQTSPYFVYASAGIFWLVWRALMHVAPIR